MSNYQPLNTPSANLLRLIQEQNAAGADYARLSGSEPFDVLISKALYNAAFSGGSLGEVLSVNGRTGIVVLSKSDVNLSNVDNTSDAAKPVSTATQTALNLKANIASPALTGVPTAPTAVSGTNTTQIATTAFVQAAGGPPVNTSAINTTGCNLIVIGMLEDFAAGGTPTDSYGNTWTGLSQYTSGYTYYIKLWYCFNPTVGSGHTFHTPEPNSRYIGVMAFTGAASSPFDAQNGAGTIYTATISTGSVTPSQANVVFVSFAANLGGGTWSVDSGMTKEADLYDSSTGGYMAMAYKIVTSTSAVNATWTASYSQTLIAATLATFKY